ncbi:DUF3606 domain-containing protein [Ideonella sp.]|uniref:DUF3606 domain-containing protein n=1 Tax=Ideonella sp. TaxID=1929293 RepID=UPI0035B43DD2
MPDNKQSAGGQDRKRINVHQDYELRDWAARFGVTKDELKRAVDEVGDEAEVVERHLREARSAERH